MKTRIYIITPLPGGQQISLPALVDAPSLAQATAFVADRLFTVRPATGHEIAALMGAGRRVVGKEALTTFSEGKSND